MDVYLQQETRRRSLTWLGIVLVGAGAGVGYYLWDRTRQPKSQIVGTLTATTTGVTATVKNIGKKPGYFKLQALIVKPGCPVQGMTVYGSGNWGEVQTRCQVVRWIPAPEADWTLINPGEQRNLTASVVPGDQIPPGTYDVYLNAAVKARLDGPRIYANEQYAWVTGVVIK